MMTYLMKMTLGANMGRFRTHKPEMLKFTKNYIEAMEERIAREYYRWIPITIQVGVGREKHWTQKGESVISEVGWSPSTNNNQAFELLSLFDLLDTNRSVLDRVMRTSRMDLDYIADQAQGDPHAATRMAILEACCQILMRESVDRGYREHTQAVATIH